MVQPANNQSQTQLIEIKNNENQVNNSQKLATQSKSTSNIWDSTKEFFSKFGEKVASLANRFEAFVIENRTAIAITAAALIAIGIPLSLFPVTAPIGSSLVGIGTLIASVNLITMGVALLKGDLKLNF